MTTHTIPATTQLALRDPAGGEDGVAVLEITSRGLDGETRSVSTIRLTLDELALLSDGFKNAYRRVRRAR